MREDTVKKAAGGGKVYALTAAGRAAAARLHAEAEAAGYCSCGRVAKAKVALTLTLAPTLTPIPTLTPTPTLTPIPTLTLSKVAPLQGAGAGNPLGLREARLPISPLYLPCISPVSPLYLPCISPASHRNALRSSAHSTPFSSQSTVAARGEL